MHEYDQPKMSPTPSGSDYDLPIAVHGVVPPSRFALFRRRVNRFVVEIDLIDEEPDTSPVRIVSKPPTTASMSNPGRMQEVLLPGARLGLVPGPEEGRHPWRVVSFHRDDLTIPIDTVSANRVARFLIQSRRIPALRDWDIAHSEVARRGGSRFDFLLRRRGGATDHGIAGEERYLEVKSCSLFNGAWAFFPDAVTTRGRRH
ncbi:MAG: DNA/RNA nuclease SfsA, partial [Spirochaetales bacterium]|nr:DNA/RNA nuclease SfsA [Spirochaetales bacterium]